MSSASVQKAKLHRLIEEEGFQAVHPCDRCIRLNKSCIKSDRSERCSECVRAGGCAKCKMSKITYSDAEWKRLVKMQKDIAEERRKVLAKLMRLERHESLLRDRAGDFISREFQTVEELEELERRDAEERERLEKERVAEQKAQDEKATQAAALPDHRAVGAGGILAATSEDPTLTQMIASADPSSSAFWDDLDVLLAGDLSGCGTSLPSAVQESVSPRGNISEPAGGSPSGSR